MGRWKYNGGIPLSRKFLLFFMAGFLGGVIFSNLIGKSYMEYAGILSEYYLNRYKYMEIVRDQLFFYLVRERLSPVLFLLLLSFTAFGKAAVYLFLAWQGFSFGTLLTISILKFGGSTEGMGGGDPAKGGVGGKCCRIFPYFYPSGGRNRPGNLGEPGYCAETVKFFVTKVIFFLQYLVEGENGGSDMLCFFEKTA